MREIKRGGRGGAKGWRWEGGGKTRAEKYIKVREDKGIKVKIRRAN